MSQRLKHLALVLALALMGCPAGGGPFGPDADGAADIDTDADADADDVSAAPRCYPEPPADFDDHTAHCFEVEQDLRDFGASDRTPFQVKFVFLDFEGGWWPPVGHFLSPSFYALHDEWYWFRLLNGVRIPGFPQAPLQGHAFDDIAQIYATFAGQSPLPVGLSYDSDRLYARRFYANAGIYPDAPRFFGIGSLLHFPANPDRVVPEALWAFELEYLDRADPGVVARFFEALEASLPASVASDLRWLTRSRAQEAVAAELAAGGGPYADRVLTYDDVVVDGEVVVYNPGIAAGRVKVLPPGFAPSDVGPRQIAVLSRVPDDIPPVAAIASAVPQTPLAHVNLLAKARGTPNAYVAGLSEWTKLGDWEYRRTPVIFQADGGAVRWHAFECVDHDDDPSTGCKYVGYDEYLALVAPPERTIAAVDDLASAPYIIDLTAGELADMAALVPLIGGKSAGIQAFNGFAAMTTPDAPAALTIRGYHEHLAPLVPALSSLIADEGFDRDPRVRLLALEGEEGFRDFYAGDVQSLTWLDVWLDGHQDGVVRQIVAQGGVERMIRDRPLDAAYEAEVRGALAARFAHLSPRQGLRFRSSATAEDVVGFNGAGLYDSNTGFFDPTLQPDGGDHKKTFAWAIRKTWASYWGFPAFEERRVAGIDHLEGNMGVLVHPRFDDDKEDANGVITFYLSDWLAPAARRMVVNVQDGALSVTNPAGGLAQPEVDVVTLGPDGAWVIERAQASSEVPEGAWVLSDGELATMAGEVAALARAWLAVSEERREPAERAESLVLDLELKRMLAGWPALANGHSRPGSLVYKQVRVLDSASVVPASLMTPWEPGTPLASMLPRDVATAADRIVALRCSNGLIDVRALRVWTRRAARDTFPFDEAPLVYRVWLRFSSAPQGWRWPVGQDVYLGHTDLASATVAADGGFTFALTEARAAELGFDTLAFDGETYEIAIRDGDRRVATTLDGCLSRTAFTSPAAFLEGIVAEADAAGAER